MRNALLTGLVLWVLARAAQAAEPGAVQLDDDRAGAALRSAGWIWLVGLLVVGVLLVFAFGWLTSATSQLIAARPWPAIGIGGIALLAAGQKPVTATTEIRP
jgi:hypothetical protein